MNLDIFLFSFLIARHQKQNTIWNLPAFQTTSQLSFVAIDFELLQHSILRIESCADDRQ